MPRGARRASPVSRRGLCVALYLLHAGPSPLRARRVWADRSSPRGAALSGDPRSPRGWGGHADRLSLLAPHLTTDNDRTRSRPPATRANGRWSISWRRSVLSPLFLRQSASCLRRGRPIPHPDAPESNHMALTVPARHESLDRASPVPKRPSRVSATAPAQYKVQLTVSGETYGNCVERRIFRGTRFRRRSRRDLRSRVDTVGG